MIVKRKMANVKLKHMKVQSWWFNYQSSVTSVNSFRRLCCFVICCIWMWPCHLCIFVPGAVWTRPYQPIGILEIWRVTVDNIFSVWGLYHLNTHKVFCSLMHHDSACLKRRHGSSRISLRQHPGDSYVKASPAEVLCKFKPKGQLLQISTIHRCSPVFCNEKDLTL